MMRVTRTTFNQLAQIRANANKNVALVQCLRKDGTWGKAREYKKFGNETDQDVVDRLTSLNAGSQFRLAE